VKMNGASLLAQCAHPSNETRNLLQWLPSDRRHPRALGRISNDKNQKCPLVPGPSQQLIEETHWGGGMSQRDEPGVMRGRDENSGSDPH
jgi:hypothetical protein